MCIWCVFSSLGGQIVAAGVGYLSLPDIDYSGLHKLHSLGSAWQMLLCVSGCTFEASIQLPVCLSNNGPGSRSAGGGQIPTRPCDWSGLCQLCTDGRLCWKRCQAFGCQGWWWTWSTSCPTDPPSRTTVIFHAGLPVCLSSSRLMWKRLINQ